METKIVPHVEATSKRPDHNFFLLAEETLMTFPCSLNHRAWGQSWKTVTVACFHVTSAAMQHVGKCTYHLDGVFVHLSPAPHSECEGCTSWSEDSARVTEGIIVVVGDGGGVGWF